MTFVNPTVEKLDPDAKKPIGKVKRWLDEIAVYEKDKSHKLWESRAGKIKDRYRDEKPGQTAYRDNYGTHRFNVLWSNTQTLQPALYARTPKVQIKRRFKDNDPVGRAAAQILERATEFSVDSYDFDGTMKKVRDDYLLVGRGVSRVRYEPSYEERSSKKRYAPKGGKLYDDTGGVYEGPNDNILQDDEGFYSEESYREVTYEAVTCEYVHHFDFGHTVARLWEEVRAVWFKYYMTHNELMEEFGKEIADEIMMDRGADVRDEDQKEYFKKATVYEIWDKETKTVIHICKSYPKTPLREVKDPLGLDGFFPCPKPLFATMTPDSLLPIADYVLYQDQAKVVDELTTRIENLTRALKVAGVYDTSVPEIGRLFEESAENKLIPVKDWPRFAQKGGFDGSVQFVPIKEIAQVLEILIAARDKEMQAIYEVTGMSDIIRGASDPAETATAQQIKGQFATLRLSDRQAEVQRFAKDLIALKAEIIAEHFEDDMIEKMSGSEWLAQTDDGIAINFLDAVDLLRNDLLREFRIEIETDSTIAIDEQLEKQGAIDYLNNSGEFIQRTMPIAMQLPELTPWVLETIAFASRRFHAGEQLESALDQGLKTLRDKAMQAQQNPEPPPPDPQAIKVQQDGQIAMAKLQQEGQIAQANLQKEMQKMQGDFQLGIQKIQQDFQKLQGELGLQAEELNIRRRELVTKEAELQLRAKDIGDKFLLERAKFAQSGDEQTLENLGLSPPSLKTTEVEFYTDPTTGNKRARAVTARENGEESQPSVTDFEFYTDQSSGQRRARAVTAEG